MIKKLFSYAGHYKKKAYNAVLCIFISVLMEIGVYYFIYQIMNGILYQNSFEVCIPFLIAIVGMYGCKSIFFSKGLDESHIFAYQTLYNLRISLAQKLKNISLGSVMEKGTGSYRQNFTDDIENIELLLAHGIPEGLPYFISCICVYTVIFIVDYRLGLLSICTLPIGFITMFLMAKSGTEKTEEYTRSMIELNRAIIEYVSGMQVVKIFNKMKKSSDKVQNSISGYEKFTADWYRNNFNYMAVFQSIVPSTIAVLLPVGMYMVMKGTLAVSVLLFTILLALSISTPLLKIMTLFPVLYNVVNKIKKLEEEFNQPEIITGEIELNQGELSIDFEHVSFAYENTTVLKEINFHINPKEKIGIVGESGSGKSTIGKLLMHYWDVCEGAIKIGNTDIKSISLNSLMKRISYVAQDNFLFNMSIRENLLIADPNATQYEIEEACKAACCHDVIIDLDKGYDTVVGDSGSKLSGGERQRITIARAILKKSDIIILDEATSFTDAVNDALINKAIRSLTKDKTLITIAHKLSNVKDMDKIMLIDKGILIAFDSHEELMKNEMYKNLWERYIKAKDYQFKIGGTYND